MDPRRRPPPPSASAGHRGLAVLTNFRRRSKETQPPAPKPPQDPGLSRAAPKHLDHLRSSQYRPTSSIYSQPSPMQSQFVPVTSVNIQHVRKQRIADDNDVSPPSSPETLAPRGGRQVSPDISPIDEVPDMSQLDHQGTGSQPDSRSRSNIPMMRRERRKQQEQAASTVRETKSRERLRDRSQSGAQDPPPPAGRQHHDPRWDPMTGEITSSNVGRPSQVKPAEYAQGLGINGAPQSPRTLASFGDRVKRKMPGPRPEPVDARPPWNGASGRTTLVASVQDASNVAPLRIPPKSTRRNITRLGSASPPVSPETSRFASPTGEKASRSPASPATRAGAQAYPSPPNSGKPLNAPNAQFELDNANAGTRRSDNEAGSSPTPQIPHHRHLFQRAQQQLKNGQNKQKPGAPAPAPVKTLADTNQTRYRPDPVTSPIPDDSRDQLLQVGSPGHAPQPSWTSSVYSTATTAVAPSAPPAPHPLPPLPSSNHLGAARAAPQDHAPAGDSGNQPSSRFSTTTYTPSTFESPKPPQESEMPPMPVLSPQPFSSVLDRSRPKLGGETIGAKPGVERKPIADPIVISLKAPAFSAGPKGLHPSRSRTWDTEGKGGKDPAAMMTGALGSIPRANSTSPTSSGAYASAAAFSSAFKERRLSSSSTNKDLPLPPPEMEGTTNGDRVAVLNARLAALGNRRININKSIKQMTELMPADNLLASAAVLVKREEEKKKVETLKMELADVQREEYELGLKLHRAYKRMDREANFESTTLWVRRATHD